MKPGEYEGKAVSWDFGYTSNNNEQVAVELQVTAGEFKGHSLTWYGNFSDEMRGDHTGTEWTLIDLKKLGWDGKDLASLDGMGSRPVKFKVEEDTYNGKTSLKVRRIFASGGLALKNKMDDNAKRAFAEKIMGKAPPPKSKAPGASDDDDIPFAPHE